MLDRLTEDRYYGSPFLSLDGFERILCVAPHPDDEVFGAGGLLALLADQGRQVQVLILSRGESASGEQSADMAATRVQESCRAAGVLGLGEPRFLGWPDRGIRYTQPLITALQAELAALQPDLLLLPALSEPHPDHQAAALGGMAAAQGSSCVPTLLFYEVGAPLHPNVRVDISAVAPRKWQAIREFTSQEALQPYEGQMRAMAAMRAFGTGCEAAEAFFRVGADELRARGAAAALPWWPLVRAQSGAANIPEQLPLVSVLMRSMNRPQLAEAIACVAAQTYPHVEVVVLNASGQRHDPVPELPGRMALRLINPPDGGPADRARAANLALAAAEGELAIFLDDDDLFRPQHIERLVQALAIAPSAVAAYADVRVEGADGQYLRDYDLPWSHSRLQGINFLPIHAVLFRTERVRRAGLAFDETLPVLEDWDFWRQLARQGEFVHCPGVTALYRQTYGQSGVGDPSHPHHWVRWHRLLLERDAARTPVHEQAAVLAWHAVELDRQESQCRRVQQELAAVQRELEAVRQAHESERAYWQALRQQEMQHARAQLQWMESSRSWRLTRPLRNFKEWLHGAEK